MDKYGRVIVGGSIYIVGMVGYIFGGGYSLICWYYGMVIDNLLEVEMVMVDGRIVMVIKEYVYIFYNNGSICNVSDVDFFWVVVGGGGGIFGIFIWLLFKFYLLLEKVIKVIIIYLIYMFFKEDVFL